MTQSARRTIDVRWLLYFVVGSFAAVAMLAALLFVAPSVSADPSTVTVNVELQAHDNSVLSIPDNGSASYYAAGSWHTITEQNPNNHSIVRVDLAPGTYSFAVTYNGTRDQKTFTITSAPVQTVYFHAALVRVELQGFQDTGNTILSIPDNGSASYYAGGSWHAITTPDPNNGSLVQTEMLPGTYSFAATYNGTRDQKTQTIIEPNANNHANATQGVYFHAALVRVALNAHDHSFLSIPDNGSASYYAGGSWHAITMPDPNNGRLVQTEMLPGTYSFAVTYNGTRQQKTATIVEPNPNNHANAVQAVYFGTELVNVELQANNGSILSIPENGTASYYGNGKWWSITTPDVNNPRIVQTEMLPGTYSFAVTYNGTRDQKTATVKQPNANLPGNQNIQIVYFHTMLVNVWTEDTNSNILSGGMASYYAGGQWHQITTPDGNNPNIVQAQMLPGTYTFADVYNGTHMQKPFTVNQPNANLPGNQNTQSVYFHFDVNP